MALLDSQPRPLARVLLSSKHRSWSMEWLYTTAGPAVGRGARRGDGRDALDAPEDEGERGANGPRRQSGRGLAYWTDGSSARIVYVTPGDRMIALDATTGRPIPGFAQPGVVDLKQGLDQRASIRDGRIGLAAAPVIAKDVIVVGGPTGSERRRAA